MKKLSALKNILLSRGFTREVSLISKLAQDINFEIDSTSFDLGSNIPLEPIFYSIAFLDTIYSLIENVETAFRIAGEEYDNYINENQDIVRQDIVRVASENDDDDEEDKVPYLESEDFDSSFTKNHLKKIDRFIEENPNEISRDQIYELIKGRVDRSKARNQYFTKPKTRKKGTKAISVLFDGTERSRKNFERLMSDLEGIFDFMEMAAPEQKYWYSDFRLLMDEIVFSEINNEEVERVFYRILAATSQRESVLPNLRNTVRTIESIEIGEDGSPSLNPFEYFEFENDSLTPRLSESGKSGLKDIFKGIGVMAAIKTNILRALSGQDLGGEKIRPYSENLMGNTEEVTLDTHMFQLIFGRAGKPGGPTVWGTDVIKMLARRASVRFNSEIAPAEMQASLWMYRCFFETKVDIDYTYITALTSHPESEKFKASIKSAVLKLKKIVDKKSEMFAEAFESISAIDTEDAEPEEEVELIPLFEENKDIETEDEEGLDEVLEEIEEPKDDTEGEEKDYND